MIHAVNHDNWRPYGPQLDQMFDLRRTRTLDWSEPWSPTDELDDARAVYLIDVDSWGEVDAAVRLNPVEGGWWTSRWVARSLEESLGPLVIGRMEYCTAHGIGRMQVSGDSGVARRLERLDCPTSSAGPFLCLETSANALDGARRAVGIGGNLLVELVRTLAS
jgi:N-acyl-L-homoserine lactone synthetase